ncbi:MAG: 50S ribosomal protein L13 [Candidatus Uhrbacteria bacterium]|nr:50S ribosomal protein L13 [Candidatus Uhrbacteria bacterium]
MANIVRKTYSVDATGQVVGRMATQIAMHLMGKTNVAFQPHIDAGDIVVVTNVSEMTVTGKKYEDKLYHHHTGHPGGLRTKTMRQMWEKKPSDVLRAAVSRMLPKNKHRKARLLRLKIS